MGRLTARLRDIHSRMPKVKTLTMIVAMDEGRRKN